MRRGRWLLAALPIVLLAGDFLYWRLAVGQLRGEFDAWTRRARDSGWEIRHGAITAGGWPDAAVLRVEEVAVASLGTPTGRGGWSGGGDAVLLRVGLMRPNVLEITPVGLHPLRLGDGPPIPVSADHLRLHLTLRRNGPPRAAEVEAVALTAALPDLGLLSIGHLNLRAELTPEAGRDQAAVTFSASTGPVSLPDGIRWGLGSEIGETAAQGVLNGPLDPEAAPPGRAGLAAWATAWRDGGGSLELHRLAIAWGPARLDATATLALDEDLQPMGAGTGRIAGYGAALDALAANAVLSRSAAKAAKAVLSLLANTPIEGQPEEVEVPLTLQFRTLSVRQIPLVRLPEVEWPDR